MYDLQTWANGPSGNTPIDADALNYMEAGIKSADERADVGQEITTAMNATDATTVVPVSAAASVQIPGVQVTVPASTFPMRLFWCGEAGLTVAGGGLVSLELWKDGDVALTAAATHGFVATHATLYSGYQHQLQKSIRLAASNVDRVYRLKTVLYRDGGSSLAAYIFNSVANPTFIEVVRR